ncbi:hypothetical protein WJ87_31415 [Burkholderia ubonensis]|nr:hypothetical protein WJ87_31415 [Burkholderia ubonensis]
MLSGAAGVLWLGDASSMVMPRAAPGASLGTTAPETPTVAFAAPSTETRARGRPLSWGHAGAILPDTRRFAATAEPMRRDLHAPQSVTLSLDTPVLVAMCRRDAMCAQGDARDLARPRSGAAPAVAADVARGARGARAIGQPGGTPLSGAPRFAWPSADAGVRAGQIELSLRDALKRADLPADVAAQVTRIFGARLHADARAQAGDHYRILYESVGAPATRARRVRVSAVEIRLHGKTHRAAWFASAGSGPGGYYSFDGRSLAAAPFAMPLVRARISSPFGHRVHPVTGIRHGHTGVDLAAPTGTPVHAAAAGTLQFVGREPGYGNYVVVRHAGGYTSWYGHLSAFAKGLRKGMPVTRGQHLGAVGSTGTATGPHLHFEVRAKNRPVDPIRLTTAPASPPLTGARRVAFERTIRGVQQQFAALPPLRTASTGTTFGAS